MATVQVTYRARNLTGTGTVVGGDDALSDDSDSTYITVGPDVDLIRADLYATTPVPIGATLARTLEVNVRYEWPEGVTPATVRPFIHSWGYPGPGIGLPPAPSVTSWQWPASLPSHNSSSPDDVARHAVTDGSYLRFLIGDTGDAVESAEFAARFFELFLVMEYELEEVSPLAFPLRQRQRDDGLNGAPRARGGTSRQGSIRQRAYE